MIDVIPVVVVLFMSLLENSGITEDVRGRERLLTIIVTSQLESCKVATRCAAILYLGRCE